MQQEKWGPWGQGTKEPPEERKWVMNGAGCPGDSQPGKDWDIATLLLLGILARGVSQLIPDRSQTAMGLRMKGECEREDVERYNSFNELIVEGQSEKLISKWISRIQSGLPLFCFWLIPFLFVCLFVLRWEIHVCRFRLVRGSQLKGRDGSYRRERWVRWGKAQVTMFLPVL